MVLKQYFRVWHVSLFTICSFVSVTGNTSESEWLFPVSYVIIDVDAYIVFSLNSEENSQGKTEAEMHALLRKHARRCQVPACVCSLVLRRKFFERGISWACLWNRSPGPWKHSIVWGVSYFDLCAFQIRLCLRQVKCCCLFTTPFCAEFHFMLNIILYFSTINCSAVADPSRCLILSGHSY